MKRALILTALTITGLSTLALTSSCLPRHPGRPGVVILPGHPRGPAGVPKPRIVKPARPYRGAVWVEPVWHWDGKRWITRKQGYWAKPAPRGKAKGHYKNKHKSK